MADRSVKVTINGTGFAGDYTTQVYGMIPHKNGVDIDLAGVCSGHLENAEKLILPGVGAFGDGMANLRERGLDLILNRLVLERKQLILGICLG